MNDTLFDMPEPVGSGKLKLSAHTLEAINWYVKEHGLRAEISNPPAQMNFTRKIDGEQITVLLDTIIDEYKAWNKEDQKRRANERRLKKKMELNKW